MERFLKVVGDEVQNSFTVVAEVTMANIRRHKMTLTLDDGRHIPATFKPDQEASILEALREHRFLSLEVEGNGIFSQEGELEEITDIKAINTIQTGVDVTSQQSVWDAFQQVLGTVPKDVLNTLPSDSAIEIDHYLYGTPKKNDDS